MSPDDKQAKPKSRRWILGHYEVGEQIGKGGMAVVFKGVQPSLNRIVAIKVLPPNFAQTPELVERFNREAHIAAQLSHPNIVQVIDQGREDDTLFIVMEFIYGQGLDKHIEEGNLTSSKIIEYAVQILDALSYAHSKGVIHRDLKPSNILIDNNSGFAKIADFGIAQLNTQFATMVTLTTQYASLGTINYMSPEQHADAHSVTHLTDIYSFGVVLYQMLTGKLPVGHFKLPSQLNRDIPMGFDTIVSKCLQENPADRFQSAQELKTAISNISGWQFKYKNVTGRMKRSITNYGQKKGNSGTKAMIPILIVLLLALAGVGLWRGWIPGHWGDKPNPTLHPTQTASQQNQPATGSETPAALVTTAAQATPTAMATVKPKPVVQIKPTAVPTVNLTAELDKKLEKQLEEAERLVSQNRNALALNLLQSVVEDNKTNPKAAKAQLRIASIYELTNDYEQANKEYEFLIRLFPNSSQAVKSQFFLALNTEKLADEAEEDRKKELYTKAIELCREMFAENPTSEWAPSALLAEYRINWKQVEKKGLVKKKYDADQQHVFISKIDNLLKSSPKGPHVIEALKLKASILQEPELEDFEAAARTMMQLYEVNPAQGADFLYQSLNLFGKADNKIEEIQAAEKFLKEFPTDNRVTIVSNRLKVATNP